MTETPDEEYDDQDAGPASQPTGAAAKDSPTDDQDAGPATEPDQADDPQ
ncbi:MAG: hypothetical protein HYU55_12210 [Nocardioides sp.]|nr:hypothetical protein [Nocardioides sp.]